MDAEGGAIVVFQDRTWFGDPKLGAFAVYVDGCRVGVAPVLGEVVVPTGPGPHTVRVRQWWLASPPVDVVVEPGTSVRLRCDIPRSEGAFVRMGKAVLSPRHSLALDLMGEYESALESAQSQATMARGRSGLLWQAGSSIVGLVLLLAGTHDGPVYVGTGGALLIAGTVIGIAAVARARRGSG